MSDETEYEFDLIGAQSTMKEIRARLLEIIHSVNSVELLSRACTVYIMENPETYRETESTRQPIHVEYLAVQILGCQSAGSLSDFETCSWENTYEAMNIVEELFHLQYQIIVNRELETFHGENSLAWYSLKSRLESLTIRGYGFEEHIGRIAIGCLGQVDAECREFVGLTIAEGIRLYNGFKDVTERRINKIFDSQSSDYQVLSKQTKRKRRTDKGTKPSLSKALLNQSFFENIFDDATSIALVSAAELSVETGLDALTAERFLELMCAPVELFSPEYHEYPSASHPLRSRPLMKFGNRYLITNHQSVLEGIRPCFEDILANSGAWEKYQNLRSKYVESEAAEIFANSLPGSRHWLNIEWRSRADAGELDGLVSSDDATIRIQCKAGRVHDSARRGAPKRMLHDITVLIDEAAKQHSDLDRVLESNDAKRIGFKPSQTEALKRPLQFEVIVTLDDVTAWATEANKLTKIGALSAGRPIPWVVSLNDLMVVHDLLRGSLFIQYLVRRFQIESDGRLETHDELDWLGNYLDLGVDLEDFFGVEQDETKVRLLSHTDDINSWYLHRAGLKRSPTPKPSKSIPVPISQVIGELESLRPRHWVLAALALLDGNSMQKAITNHVLKEGLADFADDKVFIRANTFRPNFGLALVFHPFQSTDQVTIGIQRFAKEQRLKSGHSHEVILGLSESGDWVVGISWDRKMTSWLKALTSPIPRSFPDEFKFVGAE